MPKEQKVYIVTAILFLLFAPLALDTEDIIVPGWHIIPSNRNSVYHYIIPVWFFAVSLIYKLIKIKHVKVSKIFFSTHIFLSVLPLLVVYFFPLTIFFSESFKPDKVIQELSYIQYLWYLFIVGQILYTSLLLFKIFNVRTGSP